MCDKKIFIKQGSAYVEPLNCNFYSLKISYSKGDFQFYRPAVDGEITFQNDSFIGSTELVKCCNSIPFKIERICTGKKDIYYGEMSSSGFSVNYKTKKSISKDNSITDFWTTIFYFWKDKMNILSSQRNVVFVHDYVNQDGLYTGILNDKGTYLCDYVYFILKETLKKANLDIFLPAKSSDLSILFSSSTLPWNYKINPLKNSIAILVSELYHPTEKISTGIDFISGKVSEDLGMSLFDILEFLECFNMFPFINSQNKFQIEHISFFENGMNYVKQVSKGLNLSKIKFENDFDYSYEPDFSSVYGKVKLSFTLNEELNKSQNAFPVYTDEDLASSYFYKEVPRFDDFSYYLKEYKSNCSLRNDKNELQEKVLTYDLFYTHFDGIMLSESIDKLRYALLCLDNDNKVSVTVKGGIRIKNYEFTAKNIYDNFHTYKEQTVFLPDEYVVPLKYQPKYSLKPFTIPLSCIDFDLNSEHFLPNGKRFFIEKLSINLQSDSALVDAYYYENCGKVVELNTNGCLKEGYLISSIELVGFVFVDNQILPKPFFINTYSDGNCGTVIKIE